MKESEDAGTKQVNIHGTAQGHVIGDHNTVEVHIHGTDTKTEPEKQKWSSRLLPRVQEEAKKFLPLFFSFNKLRIIIILFVLISGIVIGPINWFISKNLPDPFDPISAANNGYIGISVGGTVFDTDRVNNQFKLDAARAYQNKDYDRAKAYWDLLAIREDETDAEAAIYEEDQDVQNSGQHYITVVVLVSLSGSNHAAVLTGRDILQGAHTAQAEYNKDLPTDIDLPSHNDLAHKLPNNYLLRLIIANVGTPSSTNTQVAERIIQARNNDPNIVGVIGQFTNEDATIRELNTAKIPMISSTQLARGIIRTPPYLLGVAPSPKQEGMAAADYACKITHDHIAIFYDPSDLHSNQLEQAFYSEFASCGGLLRGNPYMYTLGNKQILEGLLNQAWSADNNLRLIYLPSASPDDFTALLPFISNKGSQTQILGSNAFYQFVHATKPGKSFAGITYTAFAFHDEWNSSLEWKLSQKPWLLEDYPAIFNAQERHQHTLYSVQIPDADAILAYDATDVLVRASGEVLKNGQLKVTRPFDALWEKLQAISSFQGFSGCLSFDSDGQPINKAVVVLLVQNSGDNRIIDHKGQYRAVDQRR